MLEPSEKTISWNAGIGLHIAVGYDELTSDPPPKVILLLKRLVNPPVKVARSMSNALMLGLSMCFEYANLYASVDSDAVERGNIVGRNVSVMVFSLLVLSKANV
jgi:hypothetical protein